MLPAKTIVVLATLDTKGTEAAYLRECIEQNGDRSLVVDTGVMGEAVVAADISRQQVAEAGGSSLKTLIAHHSREEAAPVMARGSTYLVRDLADRGDVHGIISLGGTQGTSLSTAVMRALPYGFPKVMVSTMASGNVAPWVGTKDIMMMFSVTDIMGLNPFSRRILANAAAAVCGMAHVTVPIKGEAAPLIAITTVGITTVGAMKAVEVLQQAGYQTVVFHAIGTGGQAMEDMMSEGIIGAVLDFATIEVSNEMHHALLAGGPDRLTRAGKLGLPQVICPGAIEVLVFNEPHTVPERFKDRRLVRHTPQITDVRLNHDEMIEVAREMARRLSYTRGMAAVLIPQGGFDDYATPGEPLHDPLADGAFSDELKRLLPPEIPVIERKTHINDPAFATEAAQVLIRLIKANEAA